MSDHDCTCSHGIHMREDCIECEKSAAYAQGRVDERAAIVAWLRDSLAEDFAAAIERGEHVDAGRGKP